MILAPTRENYMKRCFELALNGIGYVAPNPMVGSVIVYNNKIIGEGYHMKYGGPHAEVNAINSVEEKNLLPESTLYVNLEPCSHQGKTPPCADLIIHSKIPKVVISNTDPNKMVMGKGIQKLKNAGVEVITDILKDEGQSLNRRFFTFHKKYRPYILLKWAQTADGFIDIQRNATTPQVPTWITNEQARMMVHKWRSEEQSIMVGTNTAFLDNPKLNVRDWSGNSPVRVLLDRRLRLPQNLNLFDGSTRTLVFTEVEVEDNDIKNTEFITLTFDEYLPEHLLGELWRRNITSLIIEGGAKTLQTFINAGLWDEVRVFTGYKNFVQGVRAPVLTNSPVTNIFNDDFKLDIFRN